MSQRCLDVVSKSLPASALGEPEGTSEGPLDTFIATRLAPDASLFEAVVVTTIAKSGGASFATKFARGQSLTHAYAGLESSLLYPTLWLRQTDRCARGILGSSRRLLLTPPKSCRLLPTPPKPCRALARSNNLWLLLRRFLLTSPRSRCLSPVNCRCPVLP